MLVTAFIAMVAGPVEALQKSKPGAAFGDERGRCNFETQDRNAIVVCGYTEKHHVDYRFRIPRHARRVHVKVDYGCRFFLDHELWWNKSRHGRRLTVEVTIHHYNSFPFALTCNIHRVLVQYRRHT